MIAKKEKNVNTSVARNKEKKVLSGVVGPWRGRLGKEKVEGVDKIVQVVSDKFLSHPNEFISYEVLAKWYEQAKGEHGGEYEIRYLQWLAAKIREYLETNHSKTLWNKQGLGYKLANPEEATIYGIKMLKKTVLIADRTRRLAKIIDKRYVPDALKRVFPEVSGGVRGLVLKSRAFLEAWDGASKEFDHAKGEYNGKNA